MSDDDGVVMAPLGKLFEVSSGSMLLHRSGTGPSVVFLAGGGTSGLYYWSVHELVAQFATSVIYDRLGLGWSDVVDLPRSGTQVTDDLHELLRTAGVPSPYVLVGHSLGGLYARLYAKRFDGEVAALVLIDPTHEGLVDYLTADESKALRELNSDDASFSPEQREEMRTTFWAAFERALADWPAEIRDPLLSQVLSPGGFRQLLRDPMNMSALFDEVREAGPEPHLPITLISTMGIDPMTSEILNPEARASSIQMNERKHRLYTHLAATLPHVQLRRLDDAGHQSVTLQRPDEVLRAIRAVTH